MRKKEIEDVFRSMGLEQTVKTVAHEGATEWRIPGESLVLKITLDNNWNMWVVGIRYATGENSPLYQVEQALEIIRKKIMDQFERIFEDLYCSNYITTHGKRGWITSSELRKLQKLTEYFPKL
jgi:hypothetical protein